MVVSLVFAGNGPIQPPFYFINRRSDDVMTTLPTQGKLIINTLGGSRTLNFTGIVKGLNPNTLYVVWVRVLYGCTEDYLYSTPNMGYDVL